MNWINLIWKLACHLIKSVLVGENIYWGFRPNLSFWGGVFFFLIWKILFMMGIVTAVMGHLFVMYHMLRNKVYLVNKPVIYLCCRDPRCIAQHCHHLGYDWGVYISGIASHHSSRLWHQCWHDDDCSSYWRCHQRGVSTIQIPRELHGNCQDCLSL